MTLYSVPKAVYEGEAMQKYLKSPGTGAFTLDLSKVRTQDGLTIQSEDGTWRSPATVGGEVVRRDMDFDLAKALTKAMIDNVATFRGKAAYMEHVALGEIDPAVTGIPRRCAGTARTRG